MMLTMVELMVMIELAGDCDKVIIPIQSSTVDYTGKSEKNGDIFIMVLMLTMVMVMIELTGDCDEVILPIQSSTGDYCRSDKNFL